MYRDVLRQYRQISTHAQQTTLTLHVVLTIPELRSNQVVVLQGAGGSRVRIDPTPRGVLLESWVLSILPPSASSAASVSSTSSSDSQEVSLAAVYKHAISLFRSLYSLTHSLPASKLYKRLRTLSGTSQSLGLEVRISTDLGGVLCFDTPLSSTHTTPALTAVHAFPALSTPLGALRASVRYLTSPHLAIDTLESVLSSRFFSQDARDQREQVADLPVEEESIAFTPTVLRHRARDSAAGSPSTGGLRGSSRASLQQHQHGPVGQGHSRTVSFPAASSEAQTHALVPSYTKHHQFHGLGVRQIDWTRRAAFRY
jgi:autophagy-related protein 13